MVVPSGRAPRRCAWRWHPPGRRRARWRPGRRPGRVGADAARAARRAGRLRPRRCHQLVWREDVLPWFRQPNEGLGDIGGISRRTRWAGGWVRETLGLWSLHRWRVRREPRRNGARRVGSAGCTQLQGGLRLGGGTMATRAKVLVAFASKHGSTRGIAHAVGGALYSCGCEVQVLPAGLVRSVLEYDAVLVGSAIYHDQWLWDARRLLRRVRGELANRPIWLFSSGPIGGTPEGDALVATGCGGGTAVPSTLLSPLRGVPVLGHATFAGRVDARAAPGGGRAGRGRVVRPAVPDVPGGPLGCPARGRAAARRSGRHPDHRRRRRAWRVVPR